MYAYTGSYRVKGSLVTIHVESAWAAAWVGTEKTRTLKLDHDVLSIVTEPMTSPVDGKTYISTTVFRRWSDGVRNAPRACAGVRAGKFAIG